MYYLCKNIVLLKNNCRNFMCLETLIPLSTTATQNPPHNPLIADYLINTFGFSRDKAISSSSLFPPKISPSNLDSIPDFLKQSGFSDTQIQSLISRRPRFLSFKLERTLKPKFKFLEDIGFSGPSLVEFILKNPNILIRGIDNTLIPNINFLRSLLHSNENIVSVLKRSSWLLSNDLPKIIGCNFAILRRSGVPDQKISHLLLRKPRLFTQKSDWLEDIVTRVENFGVKQESGLFIYAVYAMSTMSIATLEAKFEIYKSFGWSESDILSAFRKAPNFLMLSEQKIRRSMGFLMNELSYKPEYIALRPKVLMYSLEKRLKPRSKVLMILNSKGLVKKKAHVLSIMSLSEKNFLKNYVIKYVAKAPGLQEAYMGSGIQC